VVKATTNHSGTLRPRPIRQRNSAEWRPTVRRKPNGERGFSFGDCPVGFVNTVPDEVGARMSAASRLDLPLHLLLVTQG
jgi:hypothetical protein